MIPNCCPACGEKNEWKEKINPFTTGIPIGRFVRLRIGMTGTLRFHTYEFCCGRCGYAGKYDEREMEAEGTKRIP